MFDFVRIIKKFSLQDPERFHLKKNLYKIISRMLIKKMQDLDGLRFDKGKKLKFTLKIS